MIELRRREPSSEVKRQEDVEEAKERRSGVKKIGQISSIAWKERREGSHEYYTEGAVDREPRMLGVEMTRRW